MTAVATITGFPPDGKPLRVPDMAVASAQSMTEIVAASTPEDSALRFIRRELAPLARALDRYSGLHRAGGDRSDCNRHLPHSVSGSRLRRHPAATMQPVQRPFRQAVDATGAALLG